MASDVGGVGLSPIHSSFFLSEHLHTDLTTMSGLPRNRPGTWELKQPSSASSFVTITLCDLGKPQK